MKRPVKPTFSPRGDRCPICKRNFRDSDSCSHSVGEATRRIDSDYIHAVIRYEMAQANNKGDTQ